MNSTQRKADHAWYNAQTVKNNQAFELDYQAIATDWCAVLPPTANTPFSCEEVRERLAVLAHDATTQLHKDRYLPADGERLGISLAELNYVQGDALGRSIELLSHLWHSQSPSFLEGEQNRRIGMLLGDMANGYLKAATRAILEHQEALRDLQHDLEAQRDLLHETTDRLQTLHDVETGILTAQSARAIADIAVSQIMRLIPCHSAAILESNSKHGGLVVVASESSENAPGKQIPFGATNDAALHVLQRGQSIKVNDIESLKNRSPSLESGFAYGLKSFLAVPMTVRDQLLGILALTSTEIGTFTEQHEIFARQIADSVAVALHDKQLLETERKARQEAETLREVAASLGSSLEREELLEYILVQLEKVLPYDGAMITLQTKDQTQLLAHRGYDPEVIRELNNLDDVPRNIQRVVTEKTAVIITDTLTDLDWIWLSGDDEVRCWLGVPLMSQGELIGLLALGKNDPNFYQQSDADLALAFANHASVAINNARLYHEIQQQSDTLRDHVEARTRELSTLYEIAAISSRPVALQSVLEAGLARILADLAGQSGTIHVIDKQSRNLQLIAHNELAPDQIAQIAVDKGLFQILLTAHEPIVISGGGDDSEFADLAIPDFAACLLGTPMRARGEALGVLSLYCDEHLHLTQDQIKLFESVADQLGIAVDNAELRKQSRQFAVMEERERLSRDLHDSATQSLFSLTLFAAAAREKINSGQLERALQHLDDIRYTANQTHRELRLLLYELGTPEEVEENMVQALERRLRTVEGRSGILASFNATNEFDLDPKIQQVLYQIATESLNNALKHAAATHVIVEIKSDNDDVILLVKDDGRGFDLMTAREGTGMGLTNMTVRASRVGGELSIITAIDQGTEIIARFPSGGMS